MTKPSSCLLLVLLAFSVKVEVQAFAPSCRRPPLHLVKESTGSLSSTLIKSTLEDKDVERLSRARNSTDYAAPSASRRVVATTTTKEEDNSHNEERNCLKLDPLGRLRLCNRPDVLLEGLDPSIWRASRPATSHEDTPRGLRVASRERSRR